MADITDKFSKVISGSTRPVATTLSAQKVNGATSASLTAATGWDTDTAIHGIMYRTDAGTGEKVPGSQIDWKATLSGTTLSNFTVTAGTDDTYDIGTTVELSPTASWADNMVEGILADHSQTGGHEFTTVYDPSNPTLETLKVAGVSSAVNEITVTNAATGNAPSISATGGDTNIDLNLVSKGTGEISFNGIDASGAWQTWTPSYSNITVGNGTVVCYYKQIGKTVVGYWHLTFGTTSSLTSSQTVSLPVEASSHYSVFADSTAVIGESYMLEAGVDNYIGAVWLVSATTMRPVFYDAGATYLNTGSVTATSPLTWGSGDKLNLRFIYEAA